jgi:hypothetical protein
MTRILAAAAVLGATLIGLSAPAAAAPSPTLTLDQSTMTLGTRLLIQGNGFVGAHLVRVTLCGNNALDGSADCAFDTSVTAGVGTNGYFSTVLVVERPPTPCPCVVTAVNAESASPTATAPITVIGVPTAQPRPRVPDIGQLLKIDAAHVEGQGSWTSWFGASSNRTLVLTLRDVGKVSVPNPLLSVTLRKGSDTPEYVPSPRIATLQPGETRVVRIPLTLDALSMGQFTVSGAVTGYNARFTTKTSSYPWGWLIVPFILINVILWRVLRRLAMGRERKRATQVKTAADLQGTPDDDEPALA